MLIGHHKPFQNLLCSEITCGIGHLSMMDTFGGKIGPFRNFNFLKHVSVLKCYQ